MATKNAKKSPAKAKTAKTAEPKSAKTTKTDKPKKEEVIIEEVVETEKTVVGGKKKGVFSGFFSKKFDANENILTIFKSPKIYGALIGEMVGSLLITLLLLTLGLYQPLYVMFGVIAITVAIYAFSGAHINPIVTVGMMASRRVSAIRGVLYILAQTVGAWFALLIATGFNSAGGDMTVLPTLSALSEDGGLFWGTMLLEFLGATIIAFFFARAWSYRKNVLTFAAVVGGGVAMALLFAIVVSSNFFGIENSFVLNPVVAIMYQMLPTAGDGFWALFGDILVSLAVYVILPFAGGVIGFYLSDFAAKLSGKKLAGCDCCEEADCPCGDCAEC
jgi:glycerol uptake facilitator protein